MIGIINPTKIDIMSASTESLSQQLSDMSLRLGVIEDHVASLVANASTTKASRKSKAVPHANSMLTQENASAGASGLPGATTTTNKQPSVLNVMQYFAKNYEQFKSLVPAEAYELSRATKMATSTYSKGKLLEEKTIVSGVWGANKKLHEDSTSSEDLKARCGAFKEQVTAAHALWKPVETKRLTDAAVVPSSGQVDVLSQPAPSSPVD